MTAALHDLDSQSLGAVLRTALDAIVVMRPDGTVAGWNDVAARSFGWSYAEARGHRMSELIIPHRFREAHERGLAHWLATGEGPVLDRHLELAALTKAGSEIPVDLSITRTEQFGEPVFLGFLRDISERREAARRQELMIGELNHRVKNLLGVVAAIAHQTVRSVATLAEFQSAYQGRLQSLGRAHEVLTAATWQAAPLRALVQELLAPYGQATIDGPDILLAPRQLLSVAMILHELLSNAIRYGALAQPAGRVALVWATGGAGLTIEWIESGLSGIAPPTRRGFGTRMIAMNTRHELRGTTATEWRPEGITFRLAFPIEQGAQA